jgi:iron complex transport system permease protein
VSTPRKAAAKAGGPSRGRPGTASPPPPPPGSGAGPKARPAGKPKGAAKPAGKGGTASAARAGGKQATAGKPVQAPPGPGLVVGPVPVLARVAGGTASAGAVLLLAAQAFPQARSGGRDLGGAGNLLGFLPPLPLVAVAAAAAALLLRGSLPRLGLAALLSAGTLAAGPCLRTLALLDSGARATVDLPLGIATSARYQVAAGLVLLAVAYGLLVLAAVLAAVAWPRTVMEDDGEFDARRPRIAAWGLIVGGLAAIVLGMAPYASATALAPPAVPERSGLDLLGGLVLALGALTWAVVAATLRPRLAVAGAYAGVAAVLLAEGLATALLVARSPALEPTAGGVGTLLAGLAVLALAVLSSPVRGLPRRTGSVT